MELSLSIASFPLDVETAGEMEKLIDGQPAECRTLLQKELWQKDEVRGFAVLAYTDTGELAAYAAAGDLVGLHHYEWSVFVAPEFRRLGLATALAEGVHHSLEQRAAESELAAFVESNESEAWITSLGYRRAFQEFQFGAEVLEAYEIGDGLEVARFDEKHFDEVARVLSSAFDDAVLPVFEHNLADPEREVYVMQHLGRTVATATLSIEQDELWLTALAVDPTVQRSGYGQAFLQWARYKAYEKKLNRVMIEVETENKAQTVYEKAGFQKLVTLSYWQPQDI